MAATTRPHSTSQALLGPLTPLSWAFKSAQLSWARWSLDLSRHPMSRLRGFQKGCELGLGAHRVKSSFRSRKNEKPENPRPTFDFSTSKLTAYNYRQPLHFKKSSTGTLRELASSRARSPRMRSPHIESVGSERGPSLAKHLRLLVGHSNNGSWLCLLKNKAGSSAKDHKDQQSFGIPRYLPAFPFDRWIFCVPLNHRNEPTSLNRRVSPPAARHSHRGNGEGEPAWSAGDPKSWEKKT